MNESKIIAFFNGRESLLDELCVPVNDRAYMFGDAVYEVLRVYNGQVFLLEEHLMRLSSSLRALGIHFVQNINEAILRNVAANGIAEGMVYVQISRGNAHRNHSFFKLDLSPNVLVYAKPFSEHPAKNEQTHGIKAITHDDLRWGRCDIKTTNLLANCLIQSYAHEQGVGEALLLRNGMVTEGTSSNIFLVKEGTYSTPPLSNHILPGTRRKFLLDRLKATGRNIIERPIERNEIFCADEIFITSTVKEVVPIVKVDENPVGQGCIGNHTKFALGLIKDALPHA